MAPYSISISSQFHFYFFAIVIQTLCFDNFVILIGVFLKRIVLFSFFQS